MDRGDLPFPLFFDPRPIPQVGLLDLFERLGIVEVLAAVPLVQDLALRGAPRAGGRISAISSLLSAGERRRPSPRSRSPVELSIAIS
jgi:hypothetical protein